MEIIGIKTSRLEPGGDLCDFLSVALNAQKIILHDQDILVVSEKIVSVSENRLVKLSTVIPSKRAKELAAKYQVLPELTELIIQESDQLIGGIPSLILTIRENVLLANAGIDKSNTPDGWVTLLPSNSFKWAERIRNEIYARYGVKVGVIVADSRSQPLRYGLISVALGVAGIEPIVDERGRKDLFGRVLRITRRAVADDLASAAQLVIGESDESTPFALIRGAQIPFTDRQIRSEDFTIPPETCLYFNVIKDWILSGTSPLTPLEMKLLVQQS